MQISFPQVLSRCAIAGLAALASLASADDNDILISRNAVQTANIAIANFAYNNVPTSVGLEQIIQNDLQNSGRFIYTTARDFPQSVTDNLDPRQWVSKGIHYLVTGSVSNVGGQYRLTYNLFDMSGSVCTVGSVCLTNTVTLPATSSRDLAHTAANQLFEKITKIKGDFLTKIAFVRQPVAGVSNYELYVADYDGYNTKRIYASNQPITSPEFNYAGTKVAFSTYTVFNSVIKQVDINTRQVQTLVSRPGNNSAPSFGLNDKYLAYSHGENGVYDIWVKNLQTGGEVNLTRGLGRNTEPTWYGNNIYFTSDRAGTAAIYAMKPTGGAATRVSSTKGQTTNAQVSPTGKLVMINGDRITTQDLKTGEVTSISTTYLDESLSLSPHGYMIIYSSTNGNTKSINLLSIDGQARRALANSSGSNYYTAWSK